MRGVNVGVGLQRVQGGFSPAGLSDLALWLDATDEGTITSSSGNVSQWDDKSGNGRNVVQATGSSQPTTGVETINGLNALGFSGPQYLQNAAYPLISDATIIVVANVVLVNNAAESLISFDQAGNDFQLDAASATDFLYRANGPNANYNYSATNQEGADNIYSFDFDITDADSRLRINGGAAVSSAYSNDVAGTHTFRIATNRAEGNRLDVNVSEIIIYDRRLTNSEFDSVGNYLSGKYAISWSAVS